MRPPYEAPLCSIDTRRSMMSASQRKTYRPWEPQRYRQEAQSPDAKLPEGDVVFFLLDLVPRLDLRQFYAPYEERGALSCSCDPCGTGTAEHHPPIRLRSGSHTHRTTTGA